MSVPSGTGRTVIRGTGLSGEIWNTGFWWEPIVEGGVTDLASFQAYADKIEAQVETFWAAVKTHISSMYNYTGTNNYWYTGGPTATFAYAKDASAAPGTLSGNCSPMDIALVVSLRTANSGRSARGRMYVPCHDTVAPGTGTYATAGAAYANAVASLIHNMATAADHQTFMRQVSLKNSSKGIITSVVTDSVPDVQRRRVNKLAKGTVTAIAPAYT